MTCVVGLIHNKEIYMGADSVGMDGSYGYSIRKDKKIYKVGECLIGFTTSFRMGQLLGVMFTPPKIKKGVDIFAYMVSDFVEVVRDILKKYGYSKIESNKEFGGTFLVALRGRLFTIYDDFQVNEDTLPYSAIGCGKDYALGAFYSSDHLSPESRVTLALGAATKFSVGVKAPFQIERLQ